MKQTTPTATSMAVAITKDLAVATIAAGAQCRHYHRAGCAACALWQLRVRLAALNAQASSTERC